MIRGQKKTGTPGLTYDRKRRRVIIKVIVPGSGGAHRISRTIDDVTADEAVTHWQRMRDEARRTPPRRRRDQTGVHTALGRLRTRYVVLARDGFRCVLCGADAASGATLHVDHIVPVKMGGGSELSNLRTTCRECNLGKGARPAYEDAACIPPAG